MVLFINACVRKDSRTKKLAECVLNNVGGDVKEVVLADLDLPDVDEAFIDWRNGCSEGKDFADARFDLAKDFAAAETIVIAAPFWDLSFPAKFKQYIEQICVMGLTFDFSEKGEYKGLCAAEKLYYVTTAGGMIPDEAFAYGYVKALAGLFFGIKETHFVKAEGLDIVGADIEGILEAAAADAVRRLF